MEGKTQIIASKILGKKKTISCPVFQKTGSESEDEKPGKDFKN